MSDADEDEDIPLLNDIVRSGRETAPQRGAQPPPALSADEIEAIAARVVERHTHELQQAVAQAIHQALADKRAGSGTDESG